MQLRDPTAHAELLAIREACAKLGSERLIDCDLYVTLEPCAMCAAAISFARLRRLYFGAPDPKGGAVEHGPRFFAQPTCHHAPEVYGGIGEARAAELLKRFFAARRLVALRRGRREELGFGEFGEHAALRHQRIEAAAFDDTAAVEHEDARGVPDRGKPVGDDEGGAAPHHLVERRRYLCLGGGIERARRLVEDQDRRIFQQRSRNGEPLALAAGEHAAALADRGIQPVPLALDEVKRLGALAGGKDLGIGRVGIADAQILGDRAVEQTAAPERSRRYCA